jgi:hypothetical protein
MLLFSNNSSGAGNSFNIEYMLNQSFLPNVTSLTLVLTPPSLQISTPDLRTLSQAYILDTTNGLLRLMVSAPQRQYQGVIEGTCNVRVQGVEAIIEMQGLISRLGVVVRDGGDTLRTEARIKFN